ncbi:replication initiator [Mycobacterium haemophilum]|uniref:Plasmid replication initiator protein n=1 Tax=Mycobacterium haemophilum TaxID=29311 RepID=A0A0I9TFT0_9MYCO|nr:replication initiator [Mycobacterium haemophilum]KLO28406.1 plasmid replication initiator protein [Mycobacterium haemophilum]KLO37447.1 plasmid replication initiator protein [Mycobacterium haemophilum]KLO43996.1 plasmid replication initiator protein [Mycobacterium haemophilum]KLO49276.1 plasmid replication initiator protein [Mycobacterium haemophilum]
MLPGVPGTIDHGRVIDQMVRRASSLGFESWWQRAESVGFCAHPIHLTGRDQFGGEHMVWARCNNRRATVCPSCSDLYARDTWQLVHAGCQGGHHNIPTTIAGHPQVFITLTAPSYGPVHGSARRVCHNHTHIGGYRRCEHGKPLWCSRTHEDSDAAIGQPLCGDCYDYTGHVLFTWHLPELWRRFTINLRRRLAATLRAAGVDPGTVRVSFVKVVEMQARAIPHIHAVIRLDPTNSDSDTGDWASPLSPTELAALIQHAARSVTRTVEDDTTGMSRVLRFGAQIDTQPIVRQMLEADSRPAQSDSPTSGVPGRRVAGYLAKYVTKSLADFGISVRRISTAAVGELDVSDHVRGILSTIAELAQTGVTGIGKWLHTLGYRGHITTKSRRYSTTMGALRTQRAQWKSNQRSKGLVKQHVSADAVDIETLWCFDRAGHASLGDRVLATSAALRQIAARRVGLIESRQALPQAES